MILLEKIHTLSRERRKKRIRKKVSGTQERPRLTVYKSNKHMYAQIIDDISGKTLAAVSTLTKEVRDEVKMMKKTDASKVVGKVLAKKARESGIHKVVFDTNGFLYHGRIQSLASAARENGLEF